MRREETEFFRLPVRDDDLKEAQQAAEELSIDLDSFGVLVRLCLRRVGILCTLESLSCSLALDLCLSSCSGFLLGDGVVNAVNEGDYEGEIYSARDLCTVFEVERS